MTIFLQKYYLNISWYYSKIMMCHKLDQIRWINNFKYPNSIISQDHKCTIEIIFKIAQEKLVFMILKKFLCSNNMYIDGRKCFLQYIYEICHIWMKNLINK